MARGGPRFPDLCSDLEGLLATCTFTVQRERLPLGPASTWAAPRPLLPVGTGLGPSALWVCGVEGGRALRLGPSSCSAPSWSPAHSPLFIKAAHAQRLQFLIVAAGCRHKAKNHGPRGLPAAAGPLFELLPKPVVSSSSPRRPKENVWSAPWALLKGDTATASMGLLLPAEPASARLQPHRTKGMASPPCPLFSTCACLLLPDTMQTLFQIRQ